MNKKPEPRALAEEEAAAKRRYLILPDMCVCCGAPVPEGRQICWSCEHQYDAKEK